MDKARFIKWHGELAWNKLCAPIYSETPYGEAMRSAIKSLKNDPLSIEDYAHHYLIQPILYLAGFKEDRAKSLLEVAKISDKPVRRVFICKDHHGDLHVHDVSTAEKFNKICLKVLEERYEQNFYEVGYTEKDLELMIPEVPQNQVEQMRDSRIKEFLKEAWARYSQSVTKRTSQQRRLEYVKKVLKNKSGENAYSILMEDNLYLQKGKEDYIEFIDLNTRD